VLTSWLKQRDAFGELALISSSSTRKASVTCHEEVDCATLDQDNFNKSIKAIDYRRRNQLMVFILQIPCFQRLAREYLWKHLVAKFEKVKYRRGQSVYSEGQKVSFVYVVKKGEF